MPLPDPSERGTCRACGQPCAGNRYYHDECKPAKKPPTRKNRSDKIYENASVQPVKIIADIAAPAVGKAKAPSAEATANLLGRIFVYLSVFLAMGLVAGDPDLRSDDDQKRAVQSLSLSEPQAKSIMHPLARILTPTKMWQKYGGGLVQNGDIIESLVALYEWGSEVLRYKRNRTARIAQYRELQAAQAPTLLPAPPAQYAPEETEEAPIDPATPRAWSQGIKLTPELVKQMQANGAL